MWALYLSKVWTECKAFPRRQQQHSVATVSAQRDICWDILALWVFVLLGFNEKESYGITPPRHYYN